MTGALQAFVLALVASLALTPVVRTLARRHGLVAPPTGDRWHKRPTALLGGVAIFVAFGISAGVALVSSGFAPSLLNARPVAASVVAAATLMFVTGLIDDRFKLRPSSKLIMQGLAAAIVVSGGIVYPLTPWPILNVFGTVFWFIAVTNALNLLDNMDGVAVGVAAIAAMFLGATFLQEGSLELVIVCAALAGAALGFLPYNFHPSTIFMGDSGSLFLGALLASLGAAYPATVSVGIVPVLFVPVFIAVIPILDTVLVTVTRTLAGRPISTGGRDHTAHRLVALGLSERQVTVMLYGFALCGGLLALLVARAERGLGGLVGVLFLTLLAIIATYLARMHRYEPGQIRENSRMTVLVSNLLYKRRALEVLLDLLLFGAAYYAAYMLRYDGLLPPSQEILLQQSLAIVVVAKSLAFGISGVYRGVWQHASLPDFHRLIRASLLGLLFTGVALVMFFRTADFARSVMIIDTMLVLGFTAGARLSFRSFESLRRRIPSNSAEPVLVYGAGRAGETAVRELLANQSLRLTPIGFIDDDRLLHGRLIHGIPVLGGSERLLEIAFAHRAKVVMIGTRALNAQQLERLSMSCTNAGIEVVEFKLQISPCLVAARIIPQRIAVE